MASPWSPDDNTPDSDTQQKLNTLALLGLKPPAMNPLAMGRSPASRPMPPPQSLISNPNGMSPDDAAAFNLERASQYPSTPGMIDLATQASNTLNKNGTKTFDNKNTSSSTKGISVQPSIDPTRAAMNMQAEAGAARGAIPELDQQRADTDKLYDLIKMQHAALPSAYANMNLRPAQQWVDTVNHTNLAEGTPVGNPSANAAQLLPQIEALANRKGMVAKQLMEAMNQVPKGTFTQVGTENQGETTGSQITHENEGGTKATQTEGVKVPRPAAAGNPLNMAQKLDASTEKMVKPYRDASDATGKALSLLNQGKSVADMAATLETIKPMVSRLTNFEWQKLGKGGTALGDRVDQAMNTLESGKLTEENRGQYINALNTLQQAANVQAQFVTQGRHQLAGAMGIPQPLANAAIDTHYQSAPKSYDGSAALPANATLEQQKMRQYYLQQKAKGVQ